MIDSLGDDTRWFYLDADRDGIDQMRQAVLGFANLSSIQIVSHGSPGSLLLGGTVLNTATLPGYSSALAEIGAALTAGGDLLLYGCQVASGSEGIAFIEQLAVITGADVAASEDLTGAAELGGNWTLEATTGAVETLTLAPSVFTEVLTNSAPTATNLSKPEFYTEDESIFLAPIFVNDVDSTDLTVTLVISDPAAGTLSVSTAGSVTSSFDKSTGFWFASGPQISLNTLLYDLKFTPAPNYDGEFSISTSVSDGVAPPVLGIKDFTPAPINDPPKFNVVNGFIEASAIPGGALACSSENF